MSEAFEPAPGTTWSVAANGLYGCGVKRRPVKRTRERVKVVGKHHLDLAADRNGAQRPPAQYRQATALENRYRRWVRNSPADLDEFAIGCVENPNATVRMHDLYFPHKYGAKSSIDPQADGTCAGFDLIEIRIRNDVRLPAFVASLARLPRPDRTTHLVEQTYGRPGRPAASWPRPRSRTDSQIPPGLS